MSKSLRGLSERKGLNKSLLNEIIRVSSDSERDILLQELSEKYLMSKSSILGTSSFYDFLKREQAGKKVFVCDGTACLTSGKQEKLRKTLLETFSDDEIGSVTCLGHCHSNNAFLLNNTALSANEEQPLNKLIISDEYQSPDFNTGTNVEDPALIVEICNLEELYGIAGKYSWNVNSILGEIELSGLRGRGGAGFPFYLKLKSAASTVSDQKYVVCNADEGDPGAFSDKWLLEKRPHAVLFGMFIAGLVTGADTGIIYIRGEYPDAVRSVNAAVEEFQSLTNGHSFMVNSSFSFTFHVAVGAGAYICGEETSLLNSLEGLRPEVRTRPPFPTQYGLFGKPTVISNVETFANIRSILNEGSLKWASNGTGRSPGTKLVSLDGAFLKPGVYEVKMGTPLDYVFNVLGAGTRYPVKAFQVGGPLGGLVPASKINELTLDFESFSEAGFLLGHAGVVSVPADFPLIILLHHLFEFTAKESCGKCFPCRIGSERGSELLRHALISGEKIDSELFSDLLETLQLGSLCSLGNGLPLPVRNALQYFKSELEVYFTPQIK
jgi:NADH:ubiquinone oxidoreductase subunit F (NADH-binding)/NADH:ubiquinone oxidoreductase subunit E